MYAIAIVLLIQLLFFLRISKNIQLQLLACRVRESKDWKTVANGLKGPLVARATLQMDSAPCDTFLDMKVRS